MAFHERPVDAPDLARLNDPKAFAPRIEAARRDGFMDGFGEVARHRGDCCAQRGSDLRIRLGERVVENDQLPRLLAHAATFEQNLADAPEHAGAVGEPAGDVERRRHGHDAGHVDAAVRRADAVDAAEGGRHPNRAAGVAAKREIAGARRGRRGRAARGAARQSARGAWIDRSAVVCVGAGDTEEKFVAHGLADDGGACHQQLSDRCCVRKRRPMRGKPAIILLHRNAAGPKIGDLVLADLPRTSRQHDRGLDRAAMDAVPHFLR